MSLCGRIERAERPLATIGVDVGAEPVGHGANPNRQVASGRIATVMVSVIQNASGEPEVRASIIQPVAVTVIALKPIRCAQEYAVHEDVARTWLVVVAASANGVERPAPLHGVPFPLIEKRKIRGIHNCCLAQSERNQSRVCARL